MPVPCLSYHNAQFLGRAGEFRAIVADLETPEVKAVGIYGVGGMGKTALAQELAWRNAWRFPAGVVFASAIELTAGEKRLDNLLQRVAAGFCPGASAADPGRAVADHLRFKGAGLVVLDNLEDLPEADHRALADFAGGLPPNGSKLLITARTQIPVFDEAPGTRSRTLVEGLDDYNGACYVHWFALQKGVRELETELRLVDGRAEGRYEPAPQPDNIGQHPPPPGAEDEARQYRRDGFSDVTPNDIDGLCKLLDRGRPIVLGVLTHPSWDYPSVTDSGEIPMPLPGMAHSGGHAVCVVDYEKRRGIPGDGALIFRNSWSGLWASQGRYGKGYGTLFFNYARLYGMAAFA